MMRNCLKVIGLATLLQFTQANEGLAQTVVNGSRVVTGGWDASNAAFSKPAKTGTLLPATCSVGEQYFKTDAAIGQNLYFCTVANTWVQMTGGSGGGTGSGSGGSTSVLLYKGDLSGYANQNVRVPVGPDGTVLTADSSQSSGVSYRKISDSGLFANRPECTAALAGGTYYPTDGILGYRCNGTAWTAFGPISPVTPMRLAGTNSYGVVGTGASRLSSASAATGPIALTSCQSFPSTVTMILVDTEVIAGTCSGTAFTPIAGGRGYNQTGAASHSINAAATEQLFVWANARSGTSTQGSATLAASSGYLSFNAPPGVGFLPVLAKPLPNGPGSSYTVAAGFQLNGLASGDQGCGVGFRQSSNNNESFVLYHAFSGSNYFNVGEYIFTDANYSGTYFNLNPAPLATGSAIYFQLQDTLSSRSVSVSTDGLNFVLVHAVPTGDMLTPDQVFLGCTGGVVPSNANFFSWAEGN
jgi:hypothetical protein